MADKLDEIKIALDGFKGEFHDSLAMRRIYATDASVYQQLPAAVAIPKTDDDLLLLIQVASKFKVGLIPRTAGTSLAGQVVGAGMVVDMSRHMNRILEVNRDEKWVRVQPGVIRNELNMALQEQGLLFGPETSTANRAMVGGMLGNNSCGSNSVVYGSTRDKTLSVTGFLSDGSKATFENLSLEAFQQQIQPDESSLSHRIYRGLNQMLSDQQNRQQIFDGFPDPQIKRRNTGYALDLLAQTNPFGDYESGFNLAKLIAGSEGTLMLVTEIKLQCDDLPPEHSCIVCPHFESIDQALHANIVAMNHSPYASELIDRMVLQGASRNFEQRENMQFISGDPGAILIIELRAESRQALDQQVARLTDELQQHSPGYHTEVLYGNHAEPVWNLRKAGLGVVANVQGDLKPTTLIEDAAISIEQLPSYIGELNRVLEREFDIRCVHYGHAGSGEIHLRPILNLKNPEDRKKFRLVAETVAGMVKTFNGSLSGEHGDGRLRAEFIEQLLGQHNYRLLQQVKRLFDPENLFNPGKIIDAPQMDGDFRQQKPKLQQPQTMFRYPFGVLGAAEMCSGSADCRKTELTGGTMCPSYMATRNEYDSTRARANILRHVLVGADDGDSESANSPLADQSVHDVMKLCLSCKGCKSECPSNVDVAKLKAEATHAYHQVHGIPRRSKTFAGVGQLSQRYSCFAILQNWLTRSRLTSGLVKRFLGIHPHRSIPEIHRQSLQSWLNTRQPHPHAGSTGSVFLFADEFTNHLDKPVGIDAIELLEALGYRVTIPDHQESGRAAISKGLLDQAKRYAESNVKALSPIVKAEQPLIGIEPSAILTFRDEYPELVGDELLESAQSLSGNCLTLDEFLSNEVRAGRITPDRFHDRQQQIWLHGHCHQKALSKLQATVDLLQLPVNYSVQTINSGCCGMAGSFGYEREHYELSMSIGELVLFKAVRGLDEEAVVAAPGTSCRHQVYDGTGRQALHPATILRRALRDS